MIESETHAKNLLKGYLKWWGRGHARLSKRQEAIGGPEKVPNFRNEIGQGRLAVVLLFQCLAAIGASNLRI